eukprot:TRINITY_DN3572_c0_g1_i1.p1 TRINITY_DN3572_c0_g1~~TRINITY_DN3572_c0_g1_i1.p1  ORF type:complete len:644 (+),score=67.78 TRINITY_DN3572_c0_g1_i1:316-2247(+)
MDHISLASRSFAFGNDGKPVLNPPSVFSTHLQPNSPEGEEDHLTENSEQCMSENVPRLETINNIDRRLSIQHSEVVCSEPHGPSHVDSPILLETSPFSTCFQSLGSPSHCSCYTGSVNHFSFVRNDHFQALWPFNLCRASVLKENPLNFKVPVIAVRHSHASGGSAGADPSSNPAEMFDNAEPGRTSAKKEGQRIWNEVAGNVRRRYVASQPGGILQAHLLTDRRALPERLKDAFLSSFFPLGYPDSVSEGYLTYSKYRAVQHVLGAILGVMSTQSLLFAAGLRPTPAQATVISWVLKDGMAHIGKLASSSLGSRMDAEPKRWRILADTAFDFGTALEVMSPLVPAHFLLVAGLANLAKGSALVAARATRLPIYAAFAREGNLSDLYAKGEAISVLSNMVGLGIGIRLAASPLFASTEAKLLLLPFLSFGHLYCVATEMRATPINTLNAERTALLVTDYLKERRVASPGEVRYRERIIWPADTSQLAGNVRLGKPILSVIGQHPSTLAQLVESFPGEKFLLHFNEDNRGVRADLILHQEASGEDVVKAWLLAGNVAEMAKQRRDERGSQCDAAELLSTSSTFPLLPVGEAAMGGVNGDYLRKDCLAKATLRTNRMLPELLAGLREKGWLTKEFLHSSRIKAVW